LGLDKKRRCLSCGQQSEKKKATKSNWRGRPPTSRKAAAFYQGSNSPAGSKPKLPSKGKEKSVTT